MTVEWFRAVTPYISILLAVGLGVIGWFLRWLVMENNRTFQEMKQEMGRMKGDIKELEQSRQADQKYIYEQYVNKDAFYLAVGKMDGLISRIFDQLTDLNKSVHQLVGALGSEHRD